jgi:hypothetical protein
MGLRFDFGLVCAIALTAAAACGSTFTLVNGADDGGASGGDGGANDGSGGDAAPTGFCPSAGTHFFCDDFDDPGRVNNVKGAWDGELSQGTASLTIDTTRVSSAPNALAVALTKTGSTDNDQSALFKRVGKVRDVTIAYDVYVDGYGNALDAGATPSSIAFPFVLAFNTTIAISLGLIDPSTAYIYENPGTSPTVSHKLSAGLPVGHWVHVSIRIQPPGAVIARGNVHVEFDKAVVLDDPLNLGTNPATVDTAVDFGMLFAAGQSAPNLWSMHFDNLTIDRALLP